jgi:hypothetical protein
MTPEEKRRIQQGEFFDMDNRPFGTWYVFYHQARDENGLIRSTLGKTKGEVERNVDWERSHG